MNCIFHDVLQDTLPYNVYSFIETISFDIPDFLYVQMVIHYQKC